MSNPVRVPTLPGHDFGLPPGCSATRISSSLFGVLRIVMYAAPVGAFGAMAFTIGKYGLHTLTSLGSLGSLVGLAWGFVVGFALGFFVTAAPTLLRAVMALGPDAVGGVRLRAREHEEAFGLVRVGLRGAASAEVDVGNAGTLLRLMLLGALMVKTTTPAALIYPLVIGGERVETAERIVSVNPSRPAEIVGLARAIEAAGLAFRGVHYYDGHLSSFELV